MTRGDIQELLGTIDILYPNFKVKNLKETVDAWHMVLAEFRKEDVAKAMKIYAQTDTSGFAPTPSQLIAHIIAKDDMSESEAWAQVKKCLRDITAPDRDAYEELPDTIKRAIGGKQIALQWSYMDSDKVDTVIASNFKRDYRTELNRSKIDKIMPNYLNRMIEENAPEQVKRIEVRRNGVPMPEGMMDDVKERLQ